MGLLEDIHQFACQFGTRLDEIEELLTCITVSTVLKNGEDREGQQQC
jgi:hypothetical protein